MGRIARISAFGLLVLASVALPARAQDKLADQVLKLNDVTGADPLSARSSEIVANPKQADRLLAKALAMAKEKSNPLNYNAGLILAKVAEKRDNIEACERFYRICMNEAARLQSSQKLLESYGGLIDVLYEHKKYDDSARICKELLELSTDDGKPRIVLYAVTTRFGETDFIEDDSFDAGKRLRPGVHRLLIQAVAKQGKYDQALKMVDSLLKANDHWLQLQLRGWVLREAGKFPEAVKVYETVIDRIERDKNISSEDRKDYTQRYRYLLSNVYVDMKQIDKAANQLEKLVEANPNDPGYYNDLGYILADHKMHLEKAEKLIRKALELDRKRRQENPSLAPEEDHDNGAYLDSLGWVLFRQHKLKEAKEVLLKAVQDKNTQHIEIYDHLGDVHMALGEREAALAAWRRGIEVAGPGRREQERKESVEAKLKKNSQ